MEFQQNTLSVLALITLTTDLAIELKPIRANLCINAYIYVCMLTCVHTYK